MKITPVIMAGGSGSRLWPLSRLSYPKQFLALDGEQTMLQQTVSRLEGIDTAQAIIICNEEHRFLVAEQLRHIDKLHDIILEPLGRNTAPAVTLAALHALKSLPDDEDVILLVLAADHIIKDSMAFTRSIEYAIPYAHAGELVTFGITPTMPETGFGYIHRGEPIGLDSEDEDLEQVAHAFRVNSFVEKPNLSVAKKYLQEGDYYWNSGMFMFSARTYLAELSKFCPDIYNYCRQSIDSSDKDLDFIRINSDFFALCPDQSIDYAVMEHTDKSVVVPMDAGWSDVGSWSSLWDISDKDSCGNVLRGDVITHNSSNNYIHAESGLVATVGVNNLIIIQTKDAILISERTAVQDVKKIVEELKSVDRSEYNTHREIYRPWGKYDSIDRGIRYEVKRIEVKPGEGLSLQTHYHRAEHWIVVAGTAQVTIDDRKFLLSENQSVYITPGTQHCLENPGKIPLEIIEVRSGSYLGEDDIVRISDRYGRI